MVGRYGPRTGQRRHPVQAPQPLCGGQGHGLLAGGELPRGLRTVCLHRHPGDPRIATRAQSICDPGDHPGHKGYRRREIGDACTGQSRYLAGLGLGTGLCGGDAQDAASGAAHRLPNRLREDQLLTGARDVCLQSGRIKTVEKIEACSDLLRPTHLTNSGMDPKLIEQKLSRKSAHTLEDIILRMHNGILV